MPGKPTTIAGWNVIAEKVSGIGVWRIDAATGDVSWSPNMFTLFGFETGDEPPIDEAMNRAHRDDRPDACADLSRDLQGHRNPSTHASWYSSSSRSGISQPDPLNERCWRDTRTEPFLAG